MAAQVPVYMNPVYSPEYQQKLMQFQQQQEMAKALLDQGMMPLDTNNRQIGGVGYAISPMEGVAKMAQALVGAYSQKNANQGLADALRGDPVNPQQVAPMPQYGPTGGSIGDAAPSAPVPQQYTSQPQQMTSGGTPMYSRGAQNAINSITAQGADPFLVQQAMLGNEQAAKLISTFYTPTNEQKNYGALMPQYIQNQLSSGYYAANPGAAKMQEAIGTAAGGAAPYGAMPIGAAGYQPPIQQQPLQQLPVGPQGPQAQQNVNNIPPANRILGTGGIPPIEASALTAPNGPSSGINLPSPNSALMQASGGAQMPNLAGMSNDEAKAAVEAWKAGAVAQAQVVPSGGKTTAEEQAKNLVDAQKTFAVAASNLPRAMQRFEQLRQAANDASYGMGVDDRDPGATVGDWARNIARTSVGQYFEPQTAKANQIMEQATNQGILSELGPQLQGLKGNKFLETIANSASGLNLADPPEAKKQGINGLQDQYISNLMALANQRRTYGDPSAPSDMDIANMIVQNVDPTAKISVIDPTGRVGRVDAVHLPALIKDGGRIQ